MTASETVRTWRWYATTLLTIIAGIWLLVLLGLPLYVFPPVDEVPQSDAVFVLGPPMDARLALAERLYDEGLVDRIVVSVQASGGQTAPDIALCRQAEVTCEVADPSTTSGEVRMMSDLAGASDAPSVTVVTTTPHVARTRYLFSKCYPGEFTVVAAEQPESIAAWAQQYVYQSFAFAKAVFEPCP